MTARKVASRGGQGGREAGHNQVDEQPAEQVANPVAPVSQADLTAMSTRLEQMFKDTVTKVLAQHQLAQAAPSQGQAAPQDLPNQLSAEAKHLRDFRIYDPQTFNGLSEDPINVMLWLSSVERIFHYMKCPDNQKVQCAVFLLRERAAIWWLSVERMLGGNVNQFTWDQFKESFYAKFFPASLRDDKRQEFIDLKQGQMTLEEYDYEFDILSLFAPELVETEAARAQRFVWGLKNDLRGFVRALKPATQTEALRIAMDLSAHKDDDPPKVSRNGPSSGQKRKAEQKPIDVSWRNLR